ncbi:alpha/beta hydrolase [Aurantiacibacter aquimixticola]|uniref:alpha/beta hydrolase n=1 Tax=Aurantiacibacter aquimixticola TaxID=1958945 RepID=UPI00187B8440|nr:alpha/beta hydrolase [Aurantiacibacter aquimixticola]
MLPRCVLSFLPLLIAAPTCAQDHVVVEEWVEVTTSASRHVSPEHEAAETRAIDAFGPFRVLDENTVALVDITDSRSPRQFAALLAEYPAIEVVEFVEAPGTHDDIANLRVGRMIRENYIATRAPEGGSIRSGAVELFLAGAEREIHEGSEFAVHGWLDDYGRGAQDYPASAPEHRRYLDYYAEMGMEESEAAAFYAMTNSVPFENARWLSGAEMAGWIGVEPTASSATAPRLTYLDLPPLPQ